MKVNWSSITLYKIGCRVYTDWRRAVVPSAGCVAAAIRHGGVWPAVCLLYLGSPRLSARSQLLLHLHSTQHAHNAWANI